MICELNVAAKLRYNFVYMCQTALMSWSQMYYHNCKSGNKKN